MGAMTSRAHTLFKELLHYACLATGIEKTEKDQMLWPEETQDEQSGGLEKII